ncbi:ABC transporter permease [Candidatus Babeliales bacterium]|nr:ABC transporter permease [Candidatus Babeliales bacterium]
MNFVRRIFKNELPFVFACPALIWQFLFLYLPLCLIMIYSFVDVEKGFRFLRFTFFHYKEVLNLLYLKVIINSLIIAIFTSMICFLISYPVAYYFSMKVKRFKTFLLFSLILPSWTSFIVQIYCWFFLLQKNGFISFFLYKLGIISDGTHLLNNYFAILIGMVYCYLPFMILPIYAVLERMDKDLIEASADLGANHFQTLRRVIFPISFPGVLAGFLLVFIASFGEFAVPDLLGGGKNVFWGSVIVDKFLIFRDWQSGSSLTAIGVLILGSLFLFIYLLNRFFISFLKKGISYNGAR